MKLSVFTDELALDVAEAVPVLKQWGIDTVDLRSRVFGLPIEALSDAQAEAIFARGLAGVATADSRWWAAGHPPWGRRRWRRRMNECADERMRPRPVDPLRRRVYNPGLEGPKIGPQRCEVTR